MGLQRAQDKRLGLHVEQRGTLRDHVAVLRGCLDQAAVDLRVRVKSSCGLTFGGSAHAMRTWTERALVGPQIVSGSRVYPQALDLSARAGSNKLATPAAPVCQRLIPMTFRRMLYADIGWQEGLSCLSGCWQEAVGTIAEERADNVALRGRLQALQAHNSSQAEKRGVEMERLLSQVAPTVSHSSSWVGI